MINMKISFAYVIISIESERDRTEVTMTPFYVENRQLSVKIVYKIHFSFPVARIWWR